MTANGGWFQHWTFIAVNPSSTTNSVSGGAYYIKNRATSRYLITTAANNILTVANLKDSIVDTSYWTLIDITPKSGLTCPQMDVSIGNDNGRLVAKGS